VVKANLFYCLFVHIENGGKIFYVWTAVKAQKKEETESRVLWWLAVSLTQKAFLKGKTDF